MLNFAIPYQPNDGCPRIPTSETTVTASKKTVSVAPTMVCKVLSMVFLIVEQSIANPKLVLRGALARSHHY
jgi:hypothetical protein